MARRSLVTASFVLMITLQVPFVLRNAPSVRDAVEQWTV
jgi:hypothetical protein